MDYYGSVVYIDEIDAKIKQKENVEVHERW